MPDLCTPFSSTGGGISVKLVMSTSFLLPSSSLAPDNFCPLRLTGALYFPGRDSVKGFGNFVVDSSLRSALIFRSPICFILSRQFRCLCWAKKNWKESWSHNLACFYFIAQRPAFPGRLLRPHTNKAEQHWGLIVIQVPRVK